MRRYPRILFETTILLALGAAACWGWGRLTRPQSPRFFAKASDDWPVRAISYGIPSRRQPNGIQIDWISMRIDPGWTLRFPHPHMQVAEVVDESGSELFGLSFFLGKCDLDYQAPGEAREAWAAQGSDDKIISIAYPGWRYSRRVCIELDAGDSAFIEATYVGLDRNQARLADAAIASMTFTPVFRRWVHLQEVMSHLLDAGQDHLDWDEEQGWIAAFGKPIAKVDEGSIVEFRIREVPTDLGARSMPPGGPEWFHCDVKDWNHPGPAGFWLGKAWEQAKAAQGTRPES